jgi:CRISPR-associated protein Cas1
MMEPFRPAVGEALTLDMFSRSMLSVEEHFEPCKGGIYLNEAGRRKFILQYERRMERQFMSEYAGHRTTLRQQLEQQAVSYKTSLKQPETFKPFRMN